jgi:Spy/CpxP family protein refolding chaperone
VHGDKWLGLLMISVAFVIALMGMTTTFGRFHGSMNADAWQHRRHGGHGGQMMGTPGTHAMRSELFASQWMAGGFMGPGVMMLDAHMPAWIDDSYDLDLADQQIERISAIREHARDAQWNLSTRVREEQWQLMKLLRADNPDSAAVGKQYAGISDLSRQMLEQSVDARSQIDALLTQEQRDALRHRRRAGTINRREF